MFSLMWEPTANRVIIALWTVADPAKRQAIAASLKQIILELSVDPEQAGESRDRGRRIMTVAPLGIMFKVYPDKLRVRILRAWEY